MNSGRREFLKGVAMSAGAGVAAGCVHGYDHGGSDIGAPMRDFRCAPMDRIRVGIVGTGSRGTGAAKRLPQVPGVEVVAVCDIRDEYACKAAEEVFNVSGSRPQVFSGSDTVYKRLCDLPQVDVVYNATSWNAHVPVAVYAMEAGKHALIEVPAAMRIEECWELVETAERTRRHCMQLENCCYHKNALLALNLCHHGLLGDLLHGEGGYIHDRRWQIFNDEQWTRWRNRWNEKHSGNQYSTHGLGPVALDMGINRGDRFDYLVSVDGVQRGYEAFAAATLPADSPYRRERFAMADMNVTTIRTMNGRTIMLQHDVSTPRPYSRLDLIAGTKGVFRAYPRLEIFLEGADEWPDGPHGHHRFDPEKTAEIERKWTHPLIRETWQMAQGVKGEGHGGMDYVMDLRWAHCMMKGLPLDTDVYDLAAWCAVSELSERSARSRSAAMDFPDFTRGVWRQAVECRLMSASMGDA